MVHPAPANLRMRSALTQEIAKLKGVTT